MIGHWTTLAALVAYLRPMLTQGAVLTECVLSSQQEVWLQLETTGGPLAIVHALSQPIGSVYVQRALPPRAGENVFSMLRMQPVEGIAIAEANRIITVTLHDFELVLIAIPGARANCLVCSRTDQAVLAAIRPMPSVEIGCRWEPPMPAVPEPLECPDTMTLSGVLERSRLLLAQPYAEVFCIEQQLNPDTVWGMFSAAERESLIARAYQFRQQLIESPEPVIAYRDEQEQFFLRPPLSSHWRIEHVATVEEGILRCVRSRYRTWVLDQARRAIEHRIRTELRRIDHALETLQKQVASASDADRYLEWGNLLASHPHRHQRGHNELSVETWDGQQLAVPLDPSKSVLQNAEHYFAQARKIRRGAEHARRRSGELRDRRAILEAAQRELAMSPSLLEIEAIEKRLFPVSSAGTLRQGRVLTPSASRVRRFALSGGYLLLVGKDARGNQELTFGIARPHDVWLHARGVEGAHGLIPLSSRILPPPAVIEHAAAIVAYYSAARNGTYVPVSWTQRKYIRKPKRGEPGAVTLLRESVVFVTPHNPSEAER